MDFLSALGQPLQAFMNLLDVPQDLIQGAQARGRQYANTPFTGLLTHDPTGLTPMMAGIAPYVSDIVQHGWDGANDQTAELNQQQPDFYPGEKLLQGFVPNVLPALAAFTNPISGAAEGLTLAARAFPALGRAANVAHTAADLSYLPYAAGMAGDFSGNDNAYGLGTLATLAALHKAPRLSPKLLAPVAAGLDLYRASKVQQQEQRSAPAMLQSIAPGVEASVNSAMHPPLSDEERQRFLHAAMQGGTVG